MTLTVRLPETIESQLTRFCETLGLSKSQAVQSALKDWFTKPVATPAHPLLAFADAAVNACPSLNWPGPYSKDSLRQQVLASRAAHRVAEPVAAYNIEPSATKPIKKMSRRAQRAPKRSASKAAPTSQTDS